MKHQDRIQLLQWALPKLGLRWRGFRNVSGQVQKRVARRSAELGLPDIAAYRAYLEAHPDEWKRLDALCRVTISRFYRDRGVFELLARDVLPELAREARERAESRVHALSLGCAGGEEPYTLAIVWREALGRAFPELSLHIVATDADENQIARARLGRYQKATLVELPQDWFDAAFEADADAWRVRDTYREGIEFRSEDMRHGLPDGPFDLVLCRNLAFTYFDEAFRRQALGRIEARLRPGGVLVLGRHESLSDAVRFREIVPGSRVYRVEQS